MAKRLRLGFNRRNLFFGTVLVLLFCTVVLSSLFFNGYFKGQGLSSDVVIGKVMMFDEAKDYTGWPATAVHLSGEQLKEKAKKYPLIYKDIRGDVYEVRLTQADGGVLLLYDARSDKILSKFNLLDWKQ